MNRAKHCAHEFDDDVDRSLNEDTFQLFDSQPYAVIDWAQNNMNCEVFTDVAGVWKFNTIAVGHRVQLDNDLLRTFVLMSLQR